MRLLDILLTLALTHTHTYTHTHTHTSIRSILPPLPLLYIYMATVPRLPLHA